MIRLALLAAALALTAPARAAEDVQAVLSSDSPYYRRAFEAFKTAFGRPVREIPAAKGAAPSDDARVIVAFGAKAASGAAGHGGALIVTLAPGFEPPSDRERLVWVRTVPDPAVLASRLKDLQPELRTLAVLWTSPWFGEYAEALRSAALPAGFQVLSRRVDSKAELPESLRALKGSAEALWLPPDPQLLDAPAFQLAREFACGGALALYGSSAGLAEKGAVATVSVSYEETGRAAAEAAKALVSGGRVPSTLYPGEVEVVVNRGAAERCGVSIPEAALERADKAVP